MKNKKWYQESKFKWAFKAIAIGAIGFTIAASIYDGAFVGGALILGGIGLSILTALQYLLRNNP